MDGIFFANGVTGNGVKVHRYLHNNMDSLEKRLNEVHPDDPKIIVTDGVFSMEGDIVRLKDMIDIASRYKARVYLDEAHAIGVLGATGRGTEEHFGCEGASDILMCTFSKSFGSLGGFLASGYEVIDFIKHNSRPLMFSASMPPSALAAVLKSLDIIESEPERVARLQEIARRMVREFKSMGFVVGEAETPIIPLVIGDFDQTMLFWKALFENGVYANPVVSPAVPPDRSLIRTSFMATHTDEDLDEVLEITRREGKRLGLI
jgi:7-keto-8-aminopelargonate synthetase-like enzyme